jgi:hypothetical protein
MQITREVLEELLKLYEQLDYYRELHSEQLKTVQDQFGERIVAIEREGKDFMVTEKMLWEEVRYLGIDSQAGQILKEKYPDVFSSLDQINKFAKETEVFVLKHMAFNYTQMTLGNYIKLTLALIEYAKNADVHTRNSTDDSRDEVPASTSV